jgi:hypothetical protein
MPRAINGRPRTNRLPIGNHIEPQAQIFFCRGCDYSLQFLETNRCPECGREFDPAKPRTMSRRPRRARVRIIKILLVSIAVLGLIGYGVAYRQMVQVVIPPPQPIGNLNLGYPFKYTPPPPPPKLPIDGSYAIPPRKATYRVGGDFSQSFFAPAHWIDRRLRRDLWRYTGEPAWAIPAYRAIDRAGPLDPSFAPAIANVIDRVQRANMINPTASVFPQFVADVKKAADALEDQCDKWEASH